MQEAGVNFTDVQYVNLHGTSTPLNDRVEHAPMKMVFGERAHEIPIRH